tara:strand:+ start:3216 stop:3959 length:744 start_codon:yes stop_codon:yes gene_type:complete
MEKFIGFIPATLNSPNRFPGKAIANIEGMPSIIHAVKRSLLSSKINKVIVCTDSDRIAEICREYNVEFEITANNFRNGTERVASIADKYEFEFAIDISAEEPLIDPDHIDAVAECINLNNRNEDIVIPIVDFPYTSPETVIRVQSSISGRVMTLSRSEIPNRYEKPLPLISKHLPIIGFKKEALKKYIKLEPTPNEQCENIAMLRALENDMNVYCTEVKSNYFSFDLQDEILKARVAIKTDIYFGSY